MKNCFVSSRLLTVLFLFLLTGGAVAQRRRPTAAAAEGRDVVRLRKLVWQGTQAKVKTPEYRSSASKGMTTQGVWWMFTVEYDTAQEWTDELTFQFYVLALGMVDGKKAYSFYTARVIYMDIAEGRKHMATVFLRPNTVERYGVPTAFAVEIYHKGALVAQETEIATKMSQMWWKDPNVVDSDLVTKREKYLLNRAQTPFAFVDVDAYEAIKQ